MSTLSSASDYDVGYLAGPMGGLPDENRPAFARAAQEIRADGVVAMLLSPHEDGVGPEALERASARESVPYSQTSLYRGLLRTGIKRVLAANAVFVLEDWERSNGATHEVAVALAVGTPVFEWPRYRGRLVPIQDVMFGWDLSFKVISRAGIGVTGEGSLAHQVRAGRPVQAQERS